MALLTYIQMYKTVSAKELRQNLKQILDQVAAGNPVTVVYRSKPIVNIVPAEDEEEKQRQFIEAMEQATGIATSNTPIGKEKEVLRQRLQGKYGSEDIS